MPTNDFVPIAGSAGANVTTQAAYLALVSLLANGFSSGVVDSPSFNKALRQASAIAAGVAQYVADLSGDNVLDDGNAANLLASIKKAVAAQIDAQSGNYALDTGGANASVIAVNPPVTVYPPGMTVRFRKAVSNTGACTLNAGAGALPLNNDVNAALLANDAPAGAVIVASFDATANTWLINTLVPSQALSQTAADARYAAIGTGLKFGSVTAVPVSTVFTQATLAGKALYINAAGATTQTFPVANTMLAGQAVLLRNYGAGLATFVRQGTDAFDGTVDTTTFVLNSKESALAYTDAAGTWFISFFGGATGLVPQTTSDVTVSRALATTYTNGTGRPIWVSVIFNVPAGQGVSLSVNGVVRQSIGNGAATTTTMSLAVQVLPGGTYQAAGTGATTLTNWSENR